jgi:hypothetical protein
MLPWCLSFKDKCWGLGLKLRFWPEIKSTVLIRAYRKSFIAKYKGQTSNLRFGSIV